MRLRLAAILGALVAILLAGALTPLIAEAGSPQHGCFDDSRYPHNFGSHGDPTVGVPSSPNGSSGYYYLNVFACGTTVNGEIWTSDGTWRITIYNGNDKSVKLAERTATTPFEVTYNGAHNGQFIRVRFANESGATHADHGSAYANDSCALVGAPNDTSRVSSSATCNAAPPGTATGNSTATTTSSTTSTTSSTPAPTPTPSSTTNTASCKAS